MTLVAVPPTFFPHVLISQGWFNSTMTPAVYTMDSATDRIAWLGHSPYTDTLTKVYFRTSTVTTGCTIQIQIETVTNGRPSGSAWAANTNGTVVVANADDNVWKTVTLTAAASLTRGDQFAIVFTISSGTPNMPIMGMVGVVNGMAGQYPLLLQDTGGGTWAQNVNLANCISMIMEFGTLGVAHVPGTIPSDGTPAIATYNNTSNPDEKALRFQVTAPMRVIGAAVSLANIAAGADFTVSLWPDSSTTDADALAQEAVDGDNTYATSADGLFILYFATAVTLAIGTTYYLGVRADTANNLAIIEMLAPAGVTDSIKAFPIGGSSEIYKGSRQWTAGSAGSWTPTLTTLPLLYLIVDQLDDGQSVGGGGGLIRHPGMNGGLNA